MTLVSFLTIIGISIVGMPLIFLQKISVPMWSIAVALLIVSYILKVKYAGISSNLLMLNTGLIIIGVPFKGVQLYAPLFWIMGGTTAAFAVVQMLLPKLPHLKKYILSWHQRDLVSVALIGGSVLALLIAVLFQFSSTGSLTTGKNTPMNPAQELRMSKFTSFDLSVAKQLMDKNNDGKCDVCGMPLEQCIDSGQLQCSMDAKATIGVLGSQHIHQDIAIFIDGEQLDLAQPRYYVKSVFAHVEQDSQGDTGKVLHIHATGISLQLFVDSIGLGNRSWYVIVNGQKKDLKYVPQNLDKILITTAETAEEQREQVKSITDFAKKSSGEING